MSDAHAIEICSTLDDATIAGLAALLIDVVDGGASVSFLPPLGADVATAFWRRQWPVAPGGAIVVARRGADVDGVVMLAPTWAPNQPHRAEVAKLLVHRRARRRGLAGRLMETLEAHASTAGFTLLTLDTNRGSDAERLYRARGWCEAGAIPDFSRQADGSLCATVIFYKRIEPVVSPRSAR